MSSPPSRDTFWQRRIIAPTIGQLKQGVTPREIALAIAAGLVCGVFPFLGLTTALCFCVALVFRLNQPIIHLINQLLWPVQLALIPVYIKAGGWLLGWPAPAFNAEEARQLFLHSQPEFWARFGRLGGQALAAWLVSAPVLIAVSYQIARRTLDRVSAKTPPTPSSS